MITNESPIKVKKKAGQLKLPVTHTWTKSSYGRSGAGGRNHL
jgi:hypothetical protein